MKKVLKRIKFIYIPYRKIKLYFFDKKRNRDLHKKGYKVLNEVCDELKKANLNVFCAYGTLLGFIRDNSFISHDLDIDLGIIMTDNFSWEKYDSILKKIGMKLDHQYIINEETITEKTYSKDGVYIDFFLFFIDKEKNEMYSYCYDYEEKNNKLMPRIEYAPIVDKIEYREIHGIIVPIISNNIEFLEYIYGENWKIPDPNFVPPKKEYLENEARFEKV